jgi:hypothetical protein
MRHQISHRTAVILALAIAAPIAVPGSAVAQTPTTPPSVSCSASALIRPLLGAPACTTAPIACPPGTFCLWRVTVTARTLIGLGSSAASARLIADDAQSGRHVFGPWRCTGPSSGCTAVGTFTTGSFGDHQVSGACSWEGTSLGVLAQVTCSLNGELSGQIPT